MNDELDTWSEKLEKALHSSSPAHAVVESLRSFSLPLQFSEQSWLKAFNVLTQALKDSAEGVRYLVGQNLLELVRRTPRSAMPTIEKAGEMLGPLLDEVLTRHTWGIYNFIWEIPPSLPSPWREAVDEWVGNLSESQQLPPGYRKEDFDRARPLFEEATKLYDDSHHSAAENNPEWSRLLWEQAKIWMADSSPLVRGIGGYLLGVTSTEVQWDGAGNGATLLDEIFKEEKERPGVLGPFIAGSGADIEGYPPLGLPWDVWNKRLIAHLESKPSGEPDLPHLPSLYFHLTDVPWASEDEKKLREMGYGELVDREKK